MLRFYKTKSGFRAVNWLFLMTLLAAAILTACGNSGKERDSLLAVSDSESLYKVSIDIDTLVERHISLSSVMKDSKLIKLETSDECMLGRVQSVQIFDEKLFIGDAEGTVLAFDMDGQFLFKLGNKGKGPGEYINVTSWYIDGIKNQVVLLDNAQHKLLFFSGDGEFVSEENFSSVYSSDAVPAGKSQVIFYNDFNHANRDTPFALMVYDLESKEMVATAFPIEWVEPGSYLSESPFAKDGNNIYFKQCHSYQVFRINTASNTGGIDIQPYFEVDFGEQNLPAGFMTKEFDNKRMDMVENEIYKQKKYIRNVEYDMTTDYVLYSFSVGRNVFYGIYSKSDRKNILFNGTKNDVYHLPTFGIKLLPNNMAYAVVYPEFVYSARESYLKNDHEMPAKMKNYLDEVAISDNPSIIIGKMDLN
ncbi:6-bladed beta-propeller protein [Anseongella ginsenosidimutans]|uniref:6-bladed beta-propeller protein n=2 Tax=Anseongella ginsenosidimutans TaxID=496056 RepID=A0A4R3KJS9_9SPHI|nr:6-bladed beta-propeller [Anseongella ginsenosidimutans]TCS83677.1 6-bladed beta-propeller protein [Anseongella ginsenosidimutans]